MPSIGLSFFFLGLVVASVTANETSTASSTVNYSPTVTSLISTTNVTRTTSANNVTANGTMNTTEGNSTILPATPMQQGGTSTTSASPVTKSNGTTTVKTNKDKGTTAKPDKSAAVDRTGIIIIVVIILVALVFGVACFFRRKRKRHYSVDFSSRPEANIPLSTVDPELPIDAVPQNSLQTFESTEKELQEPEAKTEVQEEQTGKNKPLTDQQLGEPAVVDKSVVDPSTESAAPVPTPDSSEDKPKEDVVEQSPPAPVEPSVEEKTDDVSNKTSVESLKEANENNSNNADSSQTRDRKRIINLWDVPLNCPV